MYIGKEMRSDLIKELRTTHALQGPEQKQIKKATEEILSKQRNKASQEHMVYSSLIYCMYNSRKLISEIKIILFE